MENSILIQGLEITVFGIIMVFAGLILTFLMINLFSVIPAILEKIRKKSPEKTEKSESFSEYPVPKDHLAIIAAVLDIEKKLKILRYQGRFTFKD